MPIKRYITGHNHEIGESIYVDAPELHYFPVPGFGTAARSYATAKLAPDLADDEDLKSHLSHDSVVSRTRQEIIVPPTKLNPHTGEMELGGANVVNLDLDPGAVGHMHRTVSLDISTCVMGEVYHELDSGQKVLLRAGVSPIFLCRL
jgi:quercetin dioxygenase-like cupin family protein